MKYFIPIVAGLVLTLGGGVLVASAQTYTPLAPLPGTYTGTEAAPTTNLSLYLTGAIKLLVAISGALAVIILIIGGTQYVAAGISPSAKDDAKERIWNAIIGLILVLTSYLILNSIDPRLVEFNLTLPPVGGMPTSPTAITATPTPSKQDQPWPSDLGIRSQLNSANISINRANCKFVGQRPCTSVTELGQRAIGGLISLANNCRNCSVVVTAGTEYWMHGNRSTDLASNTTEHRPGGNVVDLSIGNANLNTYIKSKGTQISSGCSTGVRYKIGSAIYVDERISGNPPHWHVCY
ncbi:MAG: pilin [Minisyncoccota bacterium]